MKATYENLAAYNERRAAVHAAAGNAERAELCRRNATHYWNLAAQAA